VEATQEHFRETGAINTRYNQQAREIADRYQRDKVNSRKLGKPVTGNMTEDMARLEAARQRDLAEAEKRYAATKDRLEKNRPAPHALQNASGNGASGATPATGGVVSGSRVSAPASGTSRPEVVVDGSNVPKEIEFGPGGSASAQSAAAPVEGVNQIEFSGPAARASAPAAAPAPKRAAVVPPQRSLAPVRAAASARPSAVAVRAAPAPALKSKSKVTVRPAPKPKKKPRSN
jgi:hypothetical protein